ncbi:molybdopterin-dependent oxidoreductase, partial [Hydrocarboniphaga effusa]
MADGNLSMPASTPIKTTCPYCGTGCGVEATPSGKLVRVAGDPQHPTNAGRLCVKGSALGDTVVPQGRLLHPQLRDKQSPGQPLQRLSWDAALDHAAGELRRIIDTHGPESVAWYVSGQLLTEDYYVANKLVKGFVGTANIDTNSRLCMSSAVAGHKRAFGEDIVPVAYEDLDRCDLVVLVGSNTAWCHPILFQRMLRAREARPQMKIVVLDPRKTASTEMADLHLGLRAGSDVRLFNGLLAHLHRLGLTDAAFVERSTLGLDETLAAADRDASLADIAADCGLEVEALERFYALFAATERVITCFSMGVNQSSAGTDKVNSIINCHLLTGRIGKPGAGPFSLTGQPNAMGGREVGGLANMLASHMDLEREEHRELVQRFWQSPAIASRTGLKAVDLFKAIESGEIKAVWIMATNPVVSLPDADQVRRALDQCELVIVSDVMAETDTTAYAHLLLPAQGWGEKDGTVTNSERCISRQRAFVPPLGEARPDWWMLSEVARRWGHAAQFPYRAVHEIFDEHARLSAFENEGARYFDIGGLAGLDAHAYDALAPLRWPVPRTAADARHLQAFADGRFYHADGLARFVPTPARAPANAVDADYPLVL